MSKTLLLFLIVLSVVTGTTAQQRAIPDLWGHRVHDEAHVLSQAAIDRLEVMLKEHEDSTTNQIAILIIPSLEGEDLEGYSMRVAHDAWKLGEKNRDNGVLLLVAVEDRKMRIEVGHGLEGVLTDAICSRIIRNELAPHFREQRYQEGVTSAVQAIIKAIRNEYHAEADDNLQAGLSWKERLFMGLIFFTVLGIFTAVGLFVPGRGGWFLYAFLIPFYATFPMFILNITGGLITLGLYLVCFPLAKLMVGKSPWAKRMAEKAAENSNRRRSGGSWSGGSWSSGGSSSSRSSFSGGGGSFGGGGASGSW